MGCCITLLTGKVVRKQDAIESEQKDLRELVKGNNAWSFHAPPADSDAGKLYQHYLQYKAGTIGPKDKEGNDMMRDSGRRFHTGDLIVYATYPGHSWIKNNMRELAKKTTGTAYTHVALVLVVPNRAGEPREYWMEATTNPAATLDATIGSGTKRNGLWCFSAPERILSDPAELWHIPLDRKLTDKEKDALYSYASKAYWLDPTFNKQGMFDAGFDGFDGIFGEAEDGSHTEDIDRLVAEEAKGKRLEFELFCSEFVSACYKKAGLIPKNNDGKVFNPSEATPADVAEFEFLNQDAIFPLKGKREFCYSKKVQQAKEEAFQNQSKTSQKLTKKEMEQKNPDAVSFAGINHDDFEGPENAESDANSEVAEPEAGPAVDIAEPEAAVDVGEVDVDVLVDEEQAAAE